MRARVSFLGALMILGLLGVSPRATLAQDERSAPDPAQPPAVELVLAVGGEEREPIGVAEAFPADVGTVYAWLRVTGAAGGAVEVVWRHGEQEFVVPLEIGSAAWRTWSSKRIPAEWTGDWSVEVRHEGSILASANFTVG
ncbi:MAG TPA: DUF2914 domain-containing protein [Longimicrobiales bacterium]|nr:DUF2914 domain-containing protein [Longimicrobiales bacterium]